MGKDVESQKALTPINPLRSQPSNVLEGKALENVFNFTPEDQSLKLKSGSSKAEVIDTPKSMKLDSHRGASPYKVPKVEHDSEA